MTSCVRHPLRAMAAVAVALLPLAAQAQPDPAAADRVRDLRCMVVVAYIAGADPEPASQVSMGMSASYFYGRLKGREPGLAIEPALVAEFARMAPSDVQAEAVRCGREMEGMGQETQTLAASLQAAARAKAAGGEP